MSDLTHLRVERPGDGVVLITLDHPDKRNVMGPGMTDSWTLAIEDLAGDPSVRAVVVTGAGSAFCSGGGARRGSPVSRTRESTGCARG